MDMYLKTVSKIFGPEGLDCDHIDSYKGNDKRVLSRTGRRVFKVQLEEELDAYYDDDDEE